MGFTSELKPATEHGQRPTKAVPLVSVVMCTYNGERFLREAVASILGQTFSGFELIVVDDGSTDRTPQILSELQARDSRLTVLTNEHNLGIAASTNRGLAAARGQYVALQDHDDISLPQRFETQVDFLNSHPEIALVGSAATLIDETGAAYENYVEVADDLDIKWESLFRCPISHTSVMVRREVAAEVGGYALDPVLKVASDYDLLSRIAMRYRVVNLRRALVKWRRHDRASSVTWRQDQLEACAIISRRNVETVLSRGHDLSPSHREAFAGARAFACTPAGLMPTLPAAQVISGLAFLCNLLEEFSRTYAPPKKLRRRLSWVWGKHAVALSLRSSWDFRSRMRIFILGIRCLVTFSGEDR